MQDNTVGGLHHKCLCLLSLILYTLPQRRETWEQEQMAVASPGLLSMGWVDTGGTGGIAVGIGAAAGGGAGAATGSGAAGGGGAAAGLALAGAAERQGRTMVRAPASTGRDLWVQPT